MPALLFILLLTCSTSSFSITYILEDPEYSYLPVQIKLLTSGRYILTFFFNSVEKDNNISLDIHDFNSTGNGFVRFRYLDKKTHGDDYEEMKILEVIKDSIIEGSGR